ncbi:phenylalanyl-tRNA synthetase subunit beta [Serratia ficaria]|uniref:phenylalanyl-tRNA synthetase subunit beta n=1 Tax=Serratia ficaria TaxID=61651 RepID=UPI0021B7B467|nr:phenylalanyl-tRNA synthetase subunit beta [Serratia ficaria]
MATQRQKVIRNDGAVQVVEVLSGGGSWADITGKPTTFTPGAPTASALGGVKLGATIAAPAAATATADTASTATDVAGLLADHNDLVTKYNALLADAAALRTTLASVLTQLKAQTIPAAS